MIIVPISFVLQKKGERSKKDRADASCGRSHRSNSVMGVGCEEEEKIWTVVWGVLSSHARNRGSYRRMNKVVNVTL